MSQSARLSPTASHAPSDASRTEQTPATTTRQATASPTASSAWMFGPPAVRLGSDTASTPQGASAGLITNAPGAPGMGEPLPRPVQTTLAHSFGMDLGAVRVHTGPQAAEVADSLSARAFTYGNHIFLGSGERPTNVGLMAHEVTHVVQQRAPAVQMSSGASGGDPYEREAERASSAAQRGETVTVQERTYNHRVQRSIGDRIRSRLADWARRIPGYDLLSFVLGRDPVAGTAVERNAINLVRGVMSLVPGGSILFDNMQRAGVIQRAYDWFVTEIGKLGLTWDFITGLIRRFIDSLSWSDVFNISGVFERARNMFGPPLRRLVDFAIAAGRKVLEFVFEGVLSMTGGLGAQVVGIIRRAGSVFSTIINDPIRFIGNLVQAVKGGFQRFAANILTHLRAGIIGWLFGALQGAGLTLPARFDLRGIISIVLQILGLTYQRMRVRLVQLIGEPRVAMLEGAFEFLRILVTQGLAAAWQRIVEFAGNLGDMVLEGIKSWVARSIIGAAVTKLISMFNPAGAIIQAIIAVYNTVQFFIERAQQIAALVNSVLDSIANIAAGNIGAAVAYVEQTMARTLPVIIGFLARLIGLGNVSGEIRNIIRRIQAVVDRAIDRMVNWLKDRVKGFAGAGGGEDPQLRLTQGLNAGQAAVNRFAGRRVGALVLRPLLGAIRLRHRMSSLDVVARGNTWAVRGAVNPEREVPTTAQVEGGPQAGAEGLSPEAQQRWTQGVAALNALRDRAASQPIDEDELETSINQIKSRFRFRDIQIQAGEDTARINAVMNPAYTIPTLKVRKTPTGNRNFPIPIDWYKKTSNYPSFTLTITPTPTTPPPGGAAAPVQPIIRNLTPTGMSMIPVPPHLRSLHGGVTSRRVGVSASNFKSVGDIVLRTTSSGQSRAEASRLVQLFNYYESQKALSPSYASMQLDHVLDLGLGGVDTATNLWPLSAANNQKASDVYTQKIKFRVAGTAGRSTNVANAVGKYLKIKAIK